MNSKSSEHIESEVLRFCKGDNEALSLIYTSWHSELYLVAYRYLRVKENTEDVLSECFEKLLNIPNNLRYKKFIEEEISLKALLLIMVKNKSLDYIKVNKNRSRILENMKASMPYFIKNKAEDHFSNERVNELIQCLPKQEQTIIKLKINGFDRNEIGEKLKLSPKSVSNSLSKSRVSIKQLWKTIR